MKHLQRKLWAAIMVLGLALGFSLTWSSTAPTPAVAIVGSTAHYTASLHPGTVATPRAILIRTYSTVYAVLGREVPDTQRICAPSSNWRIRMVASGTRSELGGCITLRTKGHFDFHTIWKTI